MLYYSFLEVLGRFFNVPTLVLMTRPLTNMSVSFYTLALIPLVFPGSRQGPWGQDITEFRWRSLLDSCVSKSAKHLHKLCKSVRLSRSVKKLNTFFRPLGWNCYLNKGCCWLISHNEIHRDGGGGVAIIAYLLTSFESVFLWIWKI